MNYVIGIDGGGTSTSAEIKYMSCESVIRLRTGSLNFNGGATRAIEENLKNLLDEIIRQAGPVEDCSFLCIGAAGISNEKALENIQQILSCSPFRGKYRIVSDCETALYGSLNGKPGAVLIAGTGSVCYGESGTGDVFRCGGMGYLLDDAGSGFWIGREVLISAMKFFDGRKAESCFIPYLSDYGIKDRNSLSSYVYSQEDVKGAIAEFSKILPVVYSLQIPEALHTARRAAKELCSLVPPVLARLDASEQTMALWGGIFSHHEYIRQLLTDMLTERFPTLRIVTPINDAAHGACLLAEREVIKAHEAETK